MMTPHVSRTTRMILIIEFILFAYMLYVLSTSLYKSYQIDRYIRLADEENAKLAKENSLLTEDYEYYNSDAYKEKIAKQNLGLIRPGEEVLIVAADDRTYLSEEDQTAEISRRYYNSLSNPKKWFLFFFDRERFGL